MVLARQYWVTFFFWVMLLICMLLGMVMFRHVTAEVPWPDETLEPLPAVLDSNVGQEPMMVVTPAGVLHAVHPVTRKTLWTFASGREMGSVIKPMQGKESREINSSLDDDMVGGSDEQVMYKGPDGELYIVEGTQIGSTPMNIKSLVANSPHHTDDGAVVLSTVKNTAYLLNKDTGALIRKFDNSGSALEKVASIASGKGKVEDAELLLEQTAGINVDPEKKVSTLLCLRTDYSVTVQELATGRVRWNVSLADIETVPLVQPAGQTPMLGPSETNGEGKILTPVGTSMLSSRRPCQLAPIAVFSPTGEYVSNLLPVSSSFQDPGRKPNPLGEMYNSGKASGIYRVQPIRDNEEKNGLLQILEGAVRQNPYPQVGFPGQNPFDTVPSLDNRSAEHRRVTTRAGYDVAWGSIGGFLLLVTGLLSSGWYLYNRYTSGRREAKSKKVGTNKRGKRGKKGSSSTHIKRLSDEDNGNGAKPGLNAEANSELAGLRGIAMDTSAYGDGVQVGRLFVTKVVIGAGSNGTSVFEGYLDGRHVAVKRLLAHHYDRAVKEIKLLITSDHHPNVVRYFAMEETSDFVYVALERCAVSLNDLIVSESERCLSKSDSIEEDHIASKYLKLPNGKNLKLWNDVSGLPRCSPQLLQLMRDTVRGLAHLHAVGIVHRDLKPHNVLVSNSSFKLEAKLADMGLSKHLANDVSSYQDTGKGGSGSRGWQAPEQLKEGRQTRAVDVFSLGCLFFFCVTGGHHPYGEHWLRDANIANGTPDFFLIEEMPEAYHLIEAMLSNDPSKRPAAKDILLHPFFWDGEKRHAFLLKASDRVEHEDRADDSVVLRALEAIGPNVFGASWETKLDSKLLEDGRRYRKYNFSSVRDLLRIIRNKSHHFMELPPDMQESLGPFPDGFEIYFSGKFPRLLMEVYKVLYEHCKEEPTFYKCFFECNDK
ncbi:hypothetical protein KC19_2G041300 [Ceratodon purpureus]|uniref:non-specific serine/threonine protein kinase n=1 Tax=Ceratodon purpureus TaxID=3225 RepID=A0A8T0ITX3_CERPU|nr:hypothetical protein KC19_2G041300 [Ceratodon purpureus]